MLSKIKLALEHEIITAQEAQILTEFEKLRLDAIQVDEFTNAELIGKKA